MVDHGDRFPGIHDLSGVLQGIIHGAVITGTIALAQTWRKGGFPFCRLPGHWLVVIMTLAAFAHLVGWFLVVDKLRVIHWVVVGEAGAVKAGMYYYASRMCNESRWKGFFRTTCLFAVVETLLLLIWYLVLPLTSDLFFLQILNGFYVLGVPLLMIWLLTAVILDRKQAIAHDWIHWVGVLGLFAQGG